jgi:hypothetical protein
MLVCDPNAGNVLVQCHLENGHPLNEWTREEMCAAIQCGTCEHSQTEMMAVYGADVMSFQQLWKWSDFANGQVSHNDRQGHPSADRHVYNQQHGAEGHVAQKQSAGKLPFIH